MQVRVQVQAGQKLDTHMAETMSALEAASFSIHRTRADGEAATKELTSAVSQLEADLQAEVGQLGQRAAAKEKQLVEVRAAIEDLLRRAARSEAVTSAWEGELERCQRDIDDVRGEVGKGVTQEEKSNKETATALEALHVAIHANKVLKPRLGV
jgi:chromosome segregation ATPase